MPKNVISIAEPAASSARNSFGAALSSRRLHLLALAAAAAFLYLFKLGTGALLDWDEAIYAEVAREMTTSGNWLTATWQHQFFFQKPPLAFWTEAAFFHFFRADAFWARFPSALAGIGVVLLTYLIARRLVSSSAGMLAAFVLMTMNHFDRVAREGTTDSLLCLFIFLAIYAWLRLRRDEPGWFYLVCAAIGAGCMVKGPAILVAPLAIGLSWIAGLRSGDRKSEGLLSGRQLFLGVVVVLCMVVPWHLWMTARYGRSFLDDYFGYQIFERATRMIEGSSGGIGYYALVVFYGAFPWSAVAPVAAAYRIWKKQSAHALMWCVAGVVIVGYTLVPTKHQWYILPVYPAIAVEVGALLAEAGARRRIVRYATIAVLAAGMTVAVEKLVERQGDIFTNQVAELAAMAGHAPYSGPLVVIPDTRGDPQVDLPTAVFYSNRQSILLTVSGDGDKLAGLLGSSKSLDALIQKGALGEVSRLYAVHLRAQNSTAAYAEISTR